MKAIVVRENGGPGVLRLEQAPDPAPGLGEVLVRVKAAGVNPVDTYIREGKFYKARLPYTPGADASGTVESVGAGVARFKVGDRVYTAGTMSGAYAELALCEQTQVLPLPDPVSFEQGAALGVPYATAYRALALRARALPGERVLVHGASGGVGIAAVQLARAWGMTVLATAGSEAGRQLVSREGAHHVFDHRGEGCLDQVLSETGGEGVDVILEMLANANLGKDLSLLAARGRVVVIGSRGPVEIDPRLTMGRDASILGMSLMNADPAEKASIHAALFAGLENRTLRPVVGRRFPLSEASEAHAAVMEPGARGKIVLLP